MLLIAFVRGCVSGSQLVNLQEACDQGDGKYDFDSIDGYDELRLVLVLVPAAMKPGVGRVWLTFLCSDPEIQEKIRRCVKQGHIDAEDFNGVCFVG